MIRTTNVDCWRVRILKNLGTVREEFEQQDSLELDAAEAQFIFAYGTLHPDGLNSVVIITDSKVFKQFQYGQYSAQQHATLAATATTTTAPEATTTATTTTEAGCSSPRK
jgi:hypothetical protein